MAKMLNSVSDHPKITFESIDDPKHLRLTIDGILIERHTDGTLQVFADPERYSITTRAGRGEGRDTGPLKSLVVISPFLAQQTRVVSTPPPAVALPESPANPMAPRRSQMWDQLHGASTPNAPTQIHIASSGELKLKGPE